MLNHPENAEIAREEKLAEMTTKAVVCPVTPPPTSSVSSARPSSPLAGRRNPPSTATWKSTFGKTIISQTHYTLNILKKSIPISLVMLLKSPFVFLF